jgi:hypothetical protein
MSAEYLSCEATQNRPPPLSEAELLNILQLERDATASSTIKPPPFAAVFKRIITLLHSKTDF